VILNGAETPPPGAGLESVTETVAPAARDVAGTVALSSVELMNVAVRAALFKDTAVVDRKLVPIISSEVEELPAATLAGEMDVIAGSGFTTLTCCPEVAPPPGAGFVTVMVKFAMDARSDAVRDTASCVELVNVVGLASPLRLATEVETKPVPDKVTVAPDEPTAIIEGATPRRTGVGLSTFKMTGVLVIVLVPFVTAIWS
jgi:hypothetical protein